MRTRTDRRKNVRTRGEFSPKFRPPTPEQLRDLESIRVDARMGAANIARKSYPNHLGNYTGRRTPTKEPRVLTAGDRFNLLAGDYEMRARDYR